MKYNLEQVLEKNLLEKLNLEDLVFICKELLLTETGTKKVLCHRLEIFFDDIDMDLSDIIVEDSYPFMDFKPLKSIAMERFMERISGLNINEKKEHNLTVLDINSAVYDKEKSKKYKNSREVCKLIYKCFVEGVLDIKRYDILNIKNIGIFCVDIDTVFPIEKNQKIIILNEMELKVFYGTQLIEDSLLEDSFDLDKDKFEKLSEIIESDTIHECLKELSELINVDSVPDYLEESINSSLSDDLLEENCIVCLPFKGIYMEPIIYTGDFEQEGYELFSNIYNFSCDIFNPKLWLKTDIPVKRTIKPIENKDTEKKRKFF